MFRIQWDIRKIDHYECYDEFDWEVQRQKEGNSLVRYLVQIGEMAESINYNKYQNSSWIYLAISHIPIVYF